MTFQQFLPLLQGVFSLALFLLVARQGWRNPVNRLFLIFLQAMSLWGFTIGGMRLSQDLIQALWWERATLTMIAITSGSFYLFVCRFTGSGNTLETVGGRLATLFMIGTLAAAPSNLLVQGIDVDRYGNAPVWGLLFPLWVAANYALVVTAIVRLERARRASTSYEERNRYLYFIIGASFSLLGAGSDAISAAGLPVYPMGIPGNIGFSCLTSIAILRYHLLDIRLALRKMLMYLLVNTVLTIPVMAISLLWLWFIRQYQLSDWWLAPLVFIFAVTLAPVWPRGQEFLQGRLHGERYSHLRALESFSHQSRGITSMGELCKLVISLADGAVQPESVSILTASAQGDFSVAASRGIHGAESLRLDAGNPLAMWLEHRQELVRHRDLDVFPQLQAVSRQERLVLDSLGAELYSPIVTEGRLIGILALGPKRSRQLYTREDLQMLATLSRQAALNLENVRLLKLERERALHLERLEQMKSDFLLAVSHQLKTPLTSIKVSSGILGDDSQALPDVLRGKLVREIGHGVAELEAQITGILDLAKMQSASLKLDLQPTDVTEVIQDAAELVAPQVRLKEQTLELDLGNSMPQVMLDQRRIKQVLANLLSNASKFTPKGGRVSVHLTHNGDTLSVEVRDTGPGIPGEEQDKIFEAYYQVKGRSVRDSSGTGLGLTIARALVELHGGHIWTESQPGHGAAFFFRLPMQDFQDRDDPF